MYYFFNIFSLSPFRFDEILSYPGYIFSRFLATLMRHLPTSIPPPGCRQPNAGRVPVSPRHVRNAVLRSVRPGGTRFHAPDAPQSRLLERHHEVCVRYIHDGDRDRADQSPHCYDVQHLPEDPSTVRHRMEVREGETHKKYE